jgi:hypothetical protein
MDKRWDPYTVGPKWVDGDHVRWHNGALEKIGGWTKLVDTQVEGSVRQGHAWSKLDGTVNLSLASECNLYLYQSGTLYDITPLRLDDDALGTDPFTTTNGSSVVVVTHTNHGAVEGDRVTYTGQTGPINGITINTTPYTIGTILTANTYEITDSETASGDGAGGGVSVTADYTINCGSGTVVFQYGYGVGAYSAEEYGDARAEAVSLLAPTIWSLDNWGEDLIAARKNGGLYTWDASAGTGTLATLITQAPSEVGLAVVSGEDRHIILFGAHDGSAYDPMLVKWCDQEDFTTWAPSITNTAGEVRLTHGSEIKGVSKTRGQILIWTDTDLYAMQYVGGRFVFAIEHIGSGIGVTGPNAAVTWNGVSYWMSRDNFYKYDGVQQVMPNPIHEFVFEDDLDFINRDKIIAAVNKEFQEIWFFYQSKTSPTNNIDKYVKHNVMQNTWDTGTLGRTAWVSQGVFANPIAVDIDGTIWQQEVDWDDDGDPLNAFIETGAFEIGQGDEFLFIDRIIPDIKTSGGTSTITFYVAPYPNGPETSKGPYSLEDGVEKTDVRLRGRQFRYRIDWTDRDNNARIGKIRARIRPDGRRQ